VFTVSTSGILFGAEPLGELHDEFPFDILQAEPDMYGLFTPSLLERIKPLNDVLSWLLNTHFYNVRAVLNNQFVVDPTKVKISDLEDPEAGFILRLRPEAAGTDVKTAIAQLPVGDVTRSHINDMGVVVEFMQRTLGINDNLMGMIDQGGRKTATEVRTSTSFGINRLKTMCEYFSAMGFAPLTQKMIQSSQQHFDGMKKLRIVGDQARFAPEYLEVSPDKIAGFYDFVPVDGTLPVDRFAQANLWQALLGQIAQIPQIMMSYDIPRLFDYIANLAGLKNISRFRVQPAQMLQQQAQAGNVVPLSKVNQPQIPGMGPTI
jgi:hypothetical protein